MKKTVPITPAFVYSRAELADSAMRFRRLAEPADCSVLYSVKACSIGAVVDEIAPHVHGFACSSYFEMRLAATYRRPYQALHVCAPGFVRDELQEIVSEANYVTVNSLTQLALLSGLRGNASVGIRINPQTQFVDDCRYDPCRDSSKLGVALTTDSLVQIKSLIGTGVGGIHVHNNCDSENEQELQETILLLLDKFGDVLEDLEWLNLGGGYLVDAGCEKRFAEALAVLRSRFRGKIFIEPGAGLVRDAASLICSVIDKVESDGKTVCVLDTAVSHWPEVFEFQYSPPVMESNPEGKYDFTLAGRSCLAGDLFGEYGFDSPLEIGDRITLQEAGAYSNSKENWFNGVPLPAVFMFSDDEFFQVRDVGLTDYLRMCGASIDESLRKRA